MKNCFVLVCVILAVFTVADANDCEFYGHSVKVGESFSKPNDCMRITCTGPNSFSGIGCPSEYADEKLFRYIPQDNSKPYPECCDRFELIEN